MKIEKISDNQIRCTLNKGDLASREIKISELAYGTEKAKSLFRDMMQQASFEFGFEVDDLPLMIEAIPMSAESIVLIITKVDDPEELDTRFSKFAPSYEDELDEEEENAIFQNGSDFHGADEVIELFSDASGSEEQEIAISNYQELTDIIDVSDKKENSEDSKEEHSNINLIRIFSFSDFRTIERLSAVLKNVYFGENSLYKDAQNIKWYLVLNKTEHTPAEFNKVLNIVSEYGNKEAVTADKELFYMEHYQTIIKSSALQILADIL